MRVENCIVHKNDWIRDRLNMVGKTKSFFERKGRGLVLGVTQKKQHHDTH